MEMKAAILAAQGEPLVIDSVQLPRDSLAGSSPRQSSLHQRLRFTSRHDRRETRNRPVSATPARP